jgi:hypothetical protein
MDIEFIRTLTKFIENYIVKGIPWNIYEIIKPMQKEIFIEILASSFKKWHLVLTYENVSNLANKKALKQTSF